ncbi:two-component sensor histidine kinase [Brachybacterium endophyticum]|uniref:Signal transduction histidine-protein kinase/phosphatase MprB n=1 Tax=Brachybacterium endophyticum TaxID=2182385 RepID=A0A2U2RHM4_9MICO|nr:ATP-binding protein [Brachybacterium endophyticum]PWH05372.1 two-component sensor histidine kinase [Brachybacterium endophyticum]
MRPLDRLRSFKVKLGVLVAVSVCVAVVLTWLSLAADMHPLLTLPLVVIAALVVTQILARGMTSPLRQMTSAARAMARGDYSQRIETSSRDEVGELADAFTRMATELQTTDTVRRDLVANVSHELRTPVAGLRAQLENIVDGVTEPDPAALEVALTETERLSDLVDDLLDLSRIDAGVIDIDLEEFALTPFLHEAVDAADMGARARGRDLRWAIEVEPADLTATADAPRIRQVIANLLDNASRHSPPDGRVRVRAERTTRDDGVLIQVRDEGPGIARADRERVFERFQHGGGSDGSGGTGLGLAIARWAVELHGGTIEVIDDPRPRTDPDRSSVIRLTLPDMPR